LGTKENEQPDSKESSAQKSSFREKGPSGRSPGGIRKDCKERGVGIKKGECAELYRVAVRVCKPEKKKSREKGKDKRTAGVGCLLLDSARIGLENT